MSYTMIPIAVLEVYNYGKINEEFYVNYNVHIGYDRDGSKWCLKSNTGHLTCSKALYHPMIILKKNEIVYHVESTEN